MTKRSLFDRFLSGVITAALPVAGSLILYIHGRLDTLSTTCARHETAIAVLEREVSIKTLTSLGNDTSLKKPNTSNGQRFLP